MSRDPAALGLVVLVMHAIALPGLLSRCSRPELALDLEAHAATIVAPDGAFPNDMHLPPSLAARAHVLIDGVHMTTPPARLTPGVHRIEWQVDYRGGHSRKVGRTVLAGPLQDPAAPPCGVRLVIGQSLLDQLEPVLTAQIEYGLEGQFGFKQAADVALVFSSREGGSISVSADLKFGRGHVPLEVTVLPRLVSGRLSISTRVKAQVILYNETAAGALDLFGLDTRINKAVTDVARGEVDKVIGPVAALLAEPPPIALGKGRTLSLGYCADTPIQIEQGAYLSVPLAVPIVPARDGFLPVHLDPGPPPGAPSTPVAIDVSLDAGNAVLHMMWATGLLDLLLEEAGLDRRFNAQPEVQELLTVRAGPPRLSLPPTLEKSRVAGRPFSLAVEAALDVIDEPLRTPARLFGRVELDLRTDAAGVLAADPSISELALTCEPRPGRLEPCYSTLVERAREGSDVLHGPIAERLADWFRELIAGRGFGGVAGAPRFVIQSASVTPRVQSESGWVRVELAGSIE